MKKNNTAKIEFILPAPVFSAAGRLVAERVLEAVTGKVPAPKPPRPALKLLTRQPATPVVELGLIEKLEQSLSQQQGQPGYREVARFVTSAQRSPLETELSTMRADAVVRGLYAATRVARPEAVPA